MSESFHIYLLYHGIHPHLKRRKKNYLPKQVLYCSITIVMCCEDKSIYIMDMFKDTVSPPKRFDFMSSQQQNSNVN